MRIVWSWAGLHDLLAGLHDAVHWAGHWSGCVRSFPGFAHDTEYTPWQIARKW